MMEQLKNEYFTYEEAVKLSHDEKRVRSLVHFFGVPAGTLGMVVGWYSHSPQKYGVRIRWLQDDKPCPLVDGFSKTEYELMLEEVD